MYSLPKMKRWLPLLLLCPLVFAQVKVAGPSKIAGPEKVVPGGGVNNQLGPFDSYIDMNCSGPGTLLTATNLNCGTLNLGDTGGWTISPTSGMTVTGLPAGCSLGGSVLIKGATYPIEHSTQGFAYDHTNTIKVANIAALTDGYTQRTEFGCIKFGPPSVAQGSAVLFDYIVIAGNPGGKYAALQLNNGNCGGAAVYGVNIETGPGSILHSTCLPITPTATYWYSFFVDFTAGTSTLYLWDSSFVAVGNISRSLTTGDSFTVTRFGNNEAGTAAGTSSVFANMLGQSSGGSYQPLGPQNTTTLPPVYLYSKNVNLAALAGSASSTASAAINLPSGLTNVIWWSSENAASTVSSITDTAGNTYTSNAACKVTLATQGRGEFWWSTTALGNAANVVTINHTASTFRNYGVFAYAGANTASPFDVCATGTTNVGSADVTTATFTPILNDAVLQGAYITAGALYSHGTNHQLINSSGTTSAGYQQRVNAPNSSQTATMVNANTSTKWSVAIALKQ